MPAQPPTGDASLWDCCPTWKPNRNAKSPPDLQAALQQALDDYQPLCHHCRLAMHRHHRYARAIATGYGEVHRQLPVFRCCQRRRVAGGMTLPGAELRHHQLGRAGNRVGCVKSTICRRLRKAPLAAPQLPPHGTLDRTGCGGEPAGGVLN